MAGIYKLYHSSRSLQRMSLRYYRVRGNELLLVKSLTHFHFRQVIKRLGKDFIHKRDTFGNYPVNLLLDNITGDPLTSSAGQLITLLAIDGNDMGPLIYLKNTVLKMLCHSRMKKTRFVKEALDVFAQHNLYTDEDRKNLIAAIQPTRNCVSRLCERKIHAITVMKMTP